MVRPNRYLNCIWLIILNPCAAPCKLSNGGDECVIGSACRSVQSLIRLQCSFCCGRVMWSFAALGGWQWKFHRILLCIRLFYGRSFSTQIWIFLETLTARCWYLIKFKSIFGQILMKLSPCVNIHTHFIFSTNSALTCCSLGQFLNTLVLFYLTRSRYLYLHFWILTVEIDWTVEWAITSMVYSMQY